ncbi:MAG: TA system VapC family ribonuclease toxin, partial [Polyangiales bacterium]
MSYSLDVNILLFASNRDAPLYAQASAFLEQCARSPELLYLSPPVVMGYLRISTHTRVFAKPLTPQVAEKNVQMLLDLPQVRWLDVGAEAWEHYRLIATQQVVRANLVPDAYIAALLRS